MLDEIMEKLPEEFNMVEIMGKVEERTPYVIVAFQECERMNYLTGEMKRSLRELDLGLKVSLSFTRFVNLITVLRFTSNFILCTYVYYYFILGRPVILSCSTLWKHTLEYIIISLPLSLCMWGRYNMFTSSTHLYHPSSQYSFTQSIYIF